MLHLGDLAADGKGVSRDLGEARNWYLKASDNGNTNGLWRAVLLTDHFASDRNAPELAKFALNAARRGSSEARQTLMSGGDRVLSRELKAAIESELVNAGVYSGPTDGRFGRGVREGIAAYIQKPAPPPVQ
jgi:TPR repeat protein